MIYFILDLYQFHGIPVALAEVDVDQLVVELRLVLGDHQGKTRDKTTEEPDSHIFLVLDKNVQGIPWESIPSLRGKSVSRIPNMDFLIDRLDLANFEQLKSSTTNDGKDLRLFKPTVIDPRKTFFILNPSGDLKGTEGRFAHWLGSMRDVGWEGVIGHVPSEQQFINALSNNDLVM